MGTNYTWVGSTCPTCGAETEQRHIGKSSSGWCFALHVYPEEGIHDLEDWKVWWRTQSGRIKDEYDDEIDTAQMERIITERQWPPPERESMTQTPEAQARWYLINQAEPGPNGLARSKVDRNRCIGHGVGTWDLMIGEFS